MSDSVMGFPLTEYGLICAEGHRYYRRLYIPEGAWAVCPKCGEPAEAIPLPPPVLRGGGAPGGHHMNTQWRPCD